MRRVFLDANVLFSAAYRDDSGLLRLWRIHDYELLTSHYAASRQALPSEEKSAIADTIEQLFNAVAEPINASDS